MLSVAECNVNQIESNTKQIEEIKSFRYGYGSYGLIGRKCASVGVKGEGMEGRHLTLAFISSISV